MDDLNLQDWKMTDDHKSRGWKTQDWQMKDKVAGVENAGLENDERSCKGGN